MEELKHQGTTVRIDAENGAAITYFSCSKDSEEVAIINNQGYNLFEGSLLFPFPNRLVEGKYLFKGQEYQFPQNDFGRPNALHGLVHDQKFELIFKGEDYLHYQYKYDGSNEAYPFPYILDITYIVRHNELEIEVEILNTGENSMPCGFGWHPYFDLQIAKADCRFKLPKVKKVEVNEILVPTGDKSEFKDFQEFRPLTGYLLDNCFSLDQIKERSSTFLTCPGFGTLEVWQNQHFPFIQVFKPDDRSIAIEPMTCGINAFNTKQGLKELSPQEVWALKLGLKFY